MNALSRVLTKQPSHKKISHLIWVFETLKPQTSYWRRRCKLTHQLQNTPSLPWKFEQLSRHHFYLWVTILSRNISLVGWLHQTQFFKIALPNSSWYVIQYSLFWRHAPQYLLHISQTKTTLQNLVLTFEESSYVNFGFLM